jgi:methylmalonyl-CoA mutase C-terminal domain/subunit
MYLLTFLDISDKGEGHMAKRSKGGKNVKRTTGRTKGTKPRKASKGKGPKGPQARKKASKKGPAKRKAAPKRPEKGPVREPVRPRPRTGHRIRVLVAKPGLDGHDRGAKVVARGLRDAGMEVIYTGLRQTPEQIVQTAIQEDVDVIGLSCLSGAHMTLFPRIMELLREAGATDILVTAGGIVPEDDVPSLKKVGVSTVFGPGTTLEQIVSYIMDKVKR